MSKVKSFSAKSSLVGVVLSAAALIGFTVYGMVYDYFDTVVFLTLALGMVGMAAYLHHLWHGPVLSQQLSCLG